MMRELTTTRASYLRKGDVFTYVGLFKFYVATSDAADDPTFPGRVVLQVTNEPGGPELDIGCRLRAKQSVERVIPRQCPRCSQRLRWLRRDGVVGRHCVNTDCDYEVPA